MKKTQRILAVLLVGVLLLLQLPPFSFPANKAAAETEITPLSYYADKNDRYFVGMMYFDMWKNTAEKWVTDGGKQPGKGMHGEATFTYKFNFPGRKIKNVTARLYTKADNGTHPEYFEKSRSDNYEEYARAMSKGTEEKDILPFQKQGIGTDTTIIPITVNMKLDAELQARNIKYESCPNCAKEVEAWRIFQPILFKIELDGGLTVKHFTESNKPLDAIFPPRSENLKVGQTYDFTPGSNPNYEYVGYKKSSTGAPPSGNITPGQLPALTYDGKFEQYTVHLFYKELKPEEEPPEGVKCSRPTPAGSQSDKALDPMVSAVIKADQRGAHRFDVSKGIPTSESLYGNVIARNYLFQNTFQQLKGECTYNVKLKRTYELEWEDINDTRHMTIVQYYKYEIVKPYSYWTIDNLEVFGIKNAQLRNYALPGGGITIPPQNYTPPALESATNGKYYPGPAPGIIDGGSKYIYGGKSMPKVPNEERELKPVAQERTPDVEVENDTVTFDGKAIMDHKRVKKEGPTPGKIPAPVKIGQDVLYSPGHVIEMFKVNKLNTPSSGTINYLVVPGSSDGTEGKSYPINGINTVTVHTPVVMYPAVSNDKPHNQKVYPTTGRAALILDRPFVVTIPTKGQHRNILGYGNRDYAKYTAYKQVMFEFPVLNQDKTKYIPAKTWIDIPVNQEDTTFNMPVWVDEGDYTVHFRSIAENAPKDFTWEKMANFDLANHVAINTVPVQIIGRLYDFRITDVGDFDWERVFRVKKGSSQHTGALYWVGPNGIDGAPRGNQFPFLLPIRPGSHPTQGYQDIVIKTGYHIKFDFKTKGNMFSADDHVRIKPTFYFVNKDGSNRRPVDLYYHDYGRNKNFVKIGSSQDVVQRTIKLNDRMRNISQTDLNNTATFVKTYGFQNFVREASKPSLIGGYSWLDLKQRVRTMIGPVNNIPEGVKVSRTVSAEQQWYGEFSLPAAPYVVPAGYNIFEYGRTHQGLTDSSPIFLKNGYIVVNFQIETYRSGEKLPYLRYYRLPGDSTPLDNQWQMEGFSNVIGDKYGHRFASPDGDVAYYHADKSSYDDFRSMTTH